LGIYPFFPYCYLKKLAQEQYHQSPEKTLLIFFLLVFCLKLNIVVCSHTVSSEDTEEGDGGDKQRTQPVEADGQPAGRG